MVSANTKRGVDQFALVGGLKLHYLEWGMRGNPAVIMVHGWASNAHLFDRLAPHFANKYYVVALDARGHGDSDWVTDANYFTEAYVSDLEVFRQALGLPIVSLIGTSMGGRVCMAYAGLYPDRVDRVVVNDMGPVIAPQGGVRAAQLIGGEPDKFETLDGLADYWTNRGYSAIRGMTHEAILEMASHAVKKAVDGTFVWKVDPAVRENPRRADPTVSWYWARAITAPVLLIRGSESDIITPEIAQRMVTELKDCRQVVVPGVGHAPTLLEPEAFGAIKAMFGL